MSWSTKSAVWSPGVTTLDAWSPTDLAAPPVAMPTVPTAEDAIADAYALGFAEGRHEGETGERARLRNAVRVAEEAIEQIDAGASRWTGAIEENVLALSVAIARHIIDRELAIDPDIVGRLVRRALEEYPLDQTVKIRVHPSDLANIETSDERGLSGALDHPTRVAHWVGDARIASGSCVVEGRERIVDGRIDTALERLYRRLTHQHA